MGDLLFMIKMVIYTFLIVMVMQIKVGNTTLEEKVIHMTHESKMAHLFQTTAQSAATFAGQQLNRWTGSLNSNFINKHKASQIPGQRLTEKYKEMKESLREHWEESESSEEEQP